MAANRIIYCLDELTDYAEFERLADDLMVREGYREIEPLGGFKDKGRDAIHVSKAKVTTIFAYSVREDWISKLAEDAEKIKKHEHTCNELVFVTTSKVTPTERDEAVKSISNTYGWKLELYSMEKLRILVEEKHPDLIKRYPQIFPPDLFPEEPNSPRSGSSTILIHYDTSDKILGDWLTLKLLSEGYQVWSSGYKKLGDETFPESIDKAIKIAKKVIALYSHASITNPEIVRQRSIALNAIQAGAKDLIIPINVGDVNPATLDNITSSLEFIKFQDNWTEGLSNLLSTLENADIPKLLLNGKSIAANTYIRKDIISSEKELLISNALRIERIPDMLYIIISDSGIPNNSFQELQTKWAFKALGANRFISMQIPPENFYGCSFELSSTVSWRDREEIEGINSNNLISELLKKALMVKCYEKGLVKSTSENYIYFPSGLVKNDKLKYSIPGGKQNYIKVTSQRKYWTPKSSDNFIYSLAPTFYIKQNLIDEFLVLLRIRIYIADDKNVPLPYRNAFARRKRLCKDWWNNDWVTRLLAVCQFLANKDQKIILGNAEDEQLIINAKPILINSPISINESALDEKSIERDESFLQNEEDIDE